MHTEINATTSKCISSRIWKTATAANLHADGSNADGINSQN
jgi:hypothetical protein